MAIKTSKAMGLGAGMAAAAVAAALGGYLLSGKRGVKTRKQLKSWMLKAKGELLEKLETMKDVGQEAFNDSVDALVSKYSKVAGVSKEELEEMAVELKKQWKLVNKGLNKVKKMAK